MAYLQAIRQSPVNSNQLYDIKTLMVTDGGNSIETISVASVSPYRRGG